MIEKSPFKNKGCGTPELRESNSLRKRDSWSFSVKRARGREMWMQQDCRHLIVLLRCYRRKKGQRSTDSKLIKHFVKTPFKSRILKLFMLLSYVYVYVYILIYIYVNVFS